jgi:hypothetical protein
VLKQLVKRTLGLPPLNHVGGILYQMKIGKRLMGKEVHECPICLNVD